jgi:hypothetical protein
MRTEGSFSSIFGLSLTRSASLSAWPELFAWAEFAATNQSVSSATVAATGFITVDSLLSMRLIAILGCPKQSSRTALSLSDLDFSAIKLANNK